MYPCGPAISFVACFWFFPQNEHDRRFPGSGTRPLYPGGSTGQRASAWLVLALRARKMGNWRDKKLLKGAVITWERDWELLTGWKRWLVGGRRLVTKVTETSAALVPLSGT
jgi:hypothetical protein